MTVIPFITPIYHVHASLEPPLPRVEVHGGKTCSRWLSHVDVEGLALADEGASVAGLVDHDFLLDLPHGLVPNSISIYLLVY